MRQRTFGAAPGQCNLQHVDSATKFSAAFTKLRLRRDAEIEGFRPDCHAIMLLRRSLGLAVDLGTKFTYLPDGEVYSVTQIIDRPDYPDLKLALRRNED